MNYPFHLEVFSENTKESKIFLFLHGFPGRVTRNQDIALQLSKSLGAVCYLPHYTGLGKSEGVFSFVECIEQMKRLLSDLSKKHPDKEIILVGHSWGGFVSTALIQTHFQLVNKVLLLAPLVEFPPEEKIKSWIAVFAREQLLTRKYTYDEEVLFNEVVKLTSDFKIEDRLKNIQSRSKDVFLFLPTQDTVIDSAETEKTYAGSIAPQNFIKYEDDHWFAKRDLLLEKALGVVG